MANIDDIKGTGIRGMLTKGDVLAYLGKASSPTGTFKEKTEKLPELKQAPKKVEEQKVRHYTSTQILCSLLTVSQPLDGAAIRRLIVGNMTQSTAKAKAAAGEYTCICISF